jgi:hypothetical protein
MRGKQQTPRRRTKEMKMADQPTCGQGLADYSPLPAKLGELIACVARVLEAHTRALVSNDGATQKELGVYEELARQHRTIAGLLEATGEEMAGHRDLPMGEHDPNAMSSPRAVEAFRSLVKAEEDLMALLQKRVEEDRRMLVEMGELLPP